MSLRDTRLAEQYYSFLHRRIMPALEHSPVSPNQLTVCGFGLALLVPLGFHWHPWWGFGFMLFSGIADTLDGALSRARGNGSAFGAFLDSTLDRASDLAYLAGFLIAFRQYAPSLAATLLMFLGVLFTFLISYAKARAEALGATCPSGLMGRAARTIYLLLWAAVVALVPGHRAAVLWGGLALYCLLTLAALAGRLIYIRAQLTMEKKPGNHPAGMDIEKRKMLG